MEKFDRAFFRDVWQLTRPYWFSEEKWAARGLLAVIVGLNLGMVYLNVLFNEWNNQFYNSLQNFDKAGFFSALLRFSWLAALFIVAAVYQLYLNQMLQIRWRRWLTSHYLDAWLGDQTFYRMQFLHKPTDNPDQRISEDLNLFVENTLSLSLGMLSALVTLGSFVVILWGLSGVLSIPLGQQHIDIPGYMVWVALLYAIAGTWLTARIGRPLIGLNFNQQRFEADFRFSLVRLRENSESIALYGGERQEHDKFLARFSHVVSNYWDIMRRQKRLTWFTSGYNQVAVVFPILVAAPRFFAKQIQLGGLMQIASAFGQVQGALSYIISSFSDIATWHAVVDRLSSFQRNMQTTKAMHARADQQIHLAAGNTLEVADLSLHAPEGRLLVEALNLRLEPGTALLITGPSGSGKSTLIRALAGIWPFGSGQITLPPRADTLFLPQRPYLPLGSIRDVILYPYGDPQTSDAELRALLETCGLPQLIPLLHQDRAWSHTLSLGEQQRLAFARVLLQKPRWLFLDESTSALDEAAERMLYQRLRHVMPDSALISVGHRTGLSEYHARRLELLGNGTWKMEKIGPEARMPGTPPVMDERFSEA